MRYKLLFLAGVLISVGLTFILAKPAHAAVNLPPDCNFIHFSRCLHAGYFTGSTGIDSTQPSNTIFPMGNYYNYTDFHGFGVSGTQWSFPAVTGARTGRNAAYATTFLNLLRDYLNQPNWATCTLNVNQYIAPEHAPDGISQGSPCFNMRRDAVGAAAIVNSALGKNGVDFTGGPGTSVEYSAGLPYLAAIINAVNYARSNFAQFSTIIRQYDALGLIDWNFDDIAPANHLNTTGMNYGTDTQYFHLPSVYIFNSIRIRDRGGDVIMEINRSCANITNKVGPIPLISGFHISHSSNSVLNDDENPSQVTFSLNASVVDNPPVNDIVFNRGFYIQKYGSSIRTLLTVQPLGAPLHSITQNFPDTSIVNYPDQTASGVAITSLEAGDQVCVELRVRWPAGEASVSGTITSHDPELVDTSCDTVIDKPYMKFFGGDVFAGGGFNDGSGCLDNNAQIQTFTNSGNRGASSQFAATALGTMIGYPELSEGFSTANLGSPGTFARPPDGLTFANQPSGTQGNFDNSTQCFTDYWSTGASIAPDIVTPTLPVASTNTDGVHKRSGDLTILGRNIPDGVQYVLYVDGNVVIEDDITYSPTFKGGVGLTEKDIPYFVVIASGNINIDASVRELNGIFIAQGVGDTSKGIIDTCTAGSINLADPTNTLDSSFFVPPTPPNGMCRNKIEIFGFFVARKVKFHRTGGSIRSAGADTYLTSKNGAAETFVMSPEIYVGVAALCEAIPGICVNSSYNSITSLPPVL